MHSVSYIQSVHLGAGNTNRGPLVAIVTIRRLGADRGPPEHLARPCIRHWHCSFIAVRRSRLQVAFCLGDLEGLYHPPIPKYRRQKISYRDAYNEKAKGET